LAYASKPALASDAANGQAGRTADLSALDRAIILATQAGLPISTTPYADIARCLGITAQQLMDRMQHMQDAGVIRRIAAVPNHYRLGYTANAMTVWDISDERIAEVGHKVAAQSFVSHCYRRRRCLPAWPYNLFAMVHGRSEQETEQMIRELERIIGADDRAHDVLYSTRILKKTGLRLGG
jgi:DNA-binding Lrp family transcriptional regulator